MFDLSQFAIDNLIKGYEEGSFTRAQVSIFAMNYMMKGIITQDDIVYINGQMDLIDERVDEPIEDE